MQFKYLILMLFLALFFRLIRGEFKDELKRGRGIDGPIFFEPPPSYSRPFFTKSWKYREEGGGGGTEYAHGVEYFKIYLAIEARAPIQRNQLVL